MARVLLIEPDRILARNYTQVLERGSHSVTWRSGAQAAIDAIDDRLPDVLLIELHMPEHNGLEFLYECRSYPEWQHIPAILLSDIAKTTAEADNGALSSLGVIAYLYKPLTKLQRVLQAVNTALPATVT